MAARRLIAILLVLLFLSSLAAALAPVPEGVNSTSTDSAETTTGPEPAAPSDGADKPFEPRLISQSVDSRAEKEPLIRATEGDQLELRVTSWRPGTLELGGLGPTADVGPRQPALFDVLLREEGSYPVRFLGTDREIARIEVRAPGSS